MSSQVETDICNLGLGKIGGAGESELGTAFISDINNSDTVSSWCKLAFPHIRKRVISDLAVMQCPFRSTIRFKDLGAELTNTPEIGCYTYAFNVPGSALEVVRQFDELAIAVRTQPTPYQTRNNVTFQCETIANSAGTGLILLTNTLSNTARDSAFIEMVVDTPNTAAFSVEMVDCIATLLASQVAPVIGKDIKTRQDMYLEYLRVAVPAAQAANQRGFDNTSRNVPDYSGGRAKIIGRQIGYTAIGVPE
jgi:hypothetical protein